MAEYGLATDTFLEIFLTLSKYLVEEVSDLLVGGDQFLHLDVLFACILVYS